MRLWRRRWRRPAAEGRVVRVKRVLGFCRWWGTGEVAEEGSRVGRGSGTVGRAVESLCVGLHVWAHVAVTQLQGR
jgi:hypothetical protein